MIPILFPEDETQFKSNGIGRLVESKFCFVTRERNGVYECELVYPITGKWYSMMQNHCFIACTHDDQRTIQPFEIYKKSAPMDGLVTFYAHHLSYKMSRIILNPFTATTAAEAFYKIPEESINNNPFTFWTDKSGSGNFNLETPASVRSILGGTEGSILDAFGGGEYDFDFWTVRLYAEMGDDTGITIRYGKNLMDATQDVDVESRYNAIVPYWKGRSSEQGDTDITVMLPEKIVALEGVTNPQAVAIDFTSDFQQQPTEEQLRNRATAYLTNNEPWEPKENIKIDFVQLWQTKEFENYSSLLRVRLCDRVNVYYPQLGITAEGIKVVKTVYNVLLDRYDSMELGTVKTNFMQAIEQDYDKQLKKISKGFEAILRAEIDYATQLLTNPGDSHVVFVGLDEEGNKVFGNGTVPNPQEILVMNTEDPATATEILRINKNGIGFATNINGPYRSAWTLDGHFVADFITAGTINGNLIRTGMLSDYSTVTFVKTQDDVIWEGKQYYVRAPIPAYDSTAIYAIGDLVKYNGSDYRCTTAITQAEEWTASHWASAISSDYTYVLVKYPMYAELGVYYEVQTTSKNYWNLETGEFHLSATGINSALERASQQKVFNALTNDGTIQGIYMDQGSLYINASYIATGTLASVSGDTWLNLTTGTFHFGDDYYIELTEDGKMQGGYYDGTTYNDYGYIDFSANIYDTEWGSMHGIQIKTDILRITSMRIGVRQSRNVSDVTWSGANGTVNFIKSIVNRPDLGAGVIEWTSSSIEFCNGLMITEQSQ